MDCVRSSVRPPPRWWATRADRVDRTPRSRPPARRRRAREPGPRRRRYGCGAGAGSGDATGSVVGLETATSSTADGRRTRPGDAGRQPRPQRIHRQGREHQDLDRDVGDPGPDSVAGQRGASGKIRLCTESAARRKATARAGRDRLRPADRAPRGWRRRRSPSPPCARPASRSAASRTRPASRGAAPAAASAMRPDAPARPDRRCRARP